MVDTYFGETVADPYRWLEDDMSDETAQWVKTQNKLTFSYLEQVPYRDTLKQRLEKLMNYEKSAPRLLKVIILIFIKMMACKTSTFYTAAKTAVKLKCS